MSQPIIRTNYAGVPQVLVHKDTKQAVELGDTVTTFRNEPVVIIGATAPNNPSSTGRVYVSGLGLRGEFFPSVCNLEWAPMVSEAEA